jgi:hypothetical protein
MEKKLMELRVYAVMIADGLIDTAREDVYSIFIY